MSKCNLKYGLILGCLELLSLMAIPLRGQTDGAYSIKLRSVEEVALGTVMDRLDKSYPDSLAALSALRTLLLELNSEAYLLASIDEVRQIDSTTLEAAIFLGPQVRWATLRNGNIPQNYWQQAGVRASQFSDEQYDAQRLATLKDRLLQVFENNGYPFARIRLDSFVWKPPDQLAAQVFVDRGPFILFEELEMEGDVKISTAYLQNYLGIKPGTPYSREQVLKMRNRLQELPFLQEKQSPSITFWRDKALLTLYLEAKKASRFDFLLGVLPTDQFSGRRVLITGVLNAELQNQFGLGEEIRASFEQLRPGTQELELAFSYPYVLQLPFGVDANFNQYRRDSTYNDVIFDVGLRYLLEGGNYLRAFWNTTSSGLISFNETSVIQQRSLPEILDIRNLQFGLEYQLAKLDYRRNPRQGWALHLRGSIGFKNIEPNSNIIGLEDPSDPDFDFQTLYDTVTLQSTQYRGRLALSGFLPLFSATTLMGRVDAGYIGATEPVYRNEQYRIGGNQRLRGFDEESLFTTLYAIWTVEYRLLLDRNSFLYLFGDYAYTEDVTATNRMFDRPFGFGAGLSFDTQAGLFNISMAFGSQLSNPIDFRNPKLHFGYVSFF